MAVPVRVPPLVRIIAVISPKGSNPMATKSIPVVSLSQMAHGQEADMFLLMTAKEELTTRDGNAC